MSTPPNSILPLTVQPTLHILFADDDLDDCLLFKEALEEVPALVQITMVHNGDQLMQLLDKQVFDLLFLDLNMPGKNGFECVKEIKELDHLKGLPVVVLSTSFDKARVKLLHENGAQYYIRKPNTFSELKILIQKAITLTAKANIVPSSKENFVLLQDA